MNAHSVIESWETARFDGGFSGLAELGTRGFDGAVEATGTWLFLRDGEPIAVVSDLETTPRPADIDAFENAAGQTHEAPNAAVVTLAAMLALDGEVRGEYFSDDTPLSAVHDTLSGGGFTGYVELSENVLSGDYYYVYVDGDVEHLGFVGSSQRITGDDAQTKAENEIGIYAVVAVSLPDLELPDAPAEPEPEPEPTPISGSEDASASESTESPTPIENADSDDQTGTEEASEPSSKADTEQHADAAASDTNEDTESDATAAAPGSSATADSDDESPAREPTADDERRRTERDPADASGASDSPDGADTTAAATDTATESTGDTEPTETASEDPYPAMNGDDTEYSGSDTDTASNPSSSGTADESGGSRAPADGDTSRASSGINSLATKPVPSLDPQNSEHGGADSADGGDEVSASRASAPTERTRSNESSSKTGQTSTAATPAERDRPTRDEYEERIDEYEERIDELETTVADRETRIEALESELETLREERDELRAELDAIDTGDPGDSTGSTRSLSPTEALSETSLFVREDDRGGDTLADAHDGTADRDAVAENLRIGFHTTFDSDGVTVEGEPFEAWLRSASPYAFAEWLVTDLLFEIRSTGAQDGLKPLYDALPVIDRVGFDETIPLESDAEDQEVRFDIVARDKKGNPLAVAHFDQQRDPTYAETIEPFVTDSSDVGEAHETLAAAVVVTSSYFEADAMRATEEATSSSLLSRSKYRSYVKLSRSSGFHLCLVEARNGSFNLNVPEL